MINFSIKNSKQKEMEVDATYHKYFKQALHNLELNLQEDRIKTPYKLFQ
ncbi:MAG: hypothetical protein R3345_01615 [Fulvivirga sp.]|nr:hypothetical protein [Fulvivirga sp.]